MTPDLTPEGLRARAWQAMHEADSCDHSSCGVPHDNADRECEAQRIAAAFTTLVVEARRAQREADALAVCLQCREALQHEGPEAEIRNGQWVHIHGAYAWRRCGAAAIRAQEETP